MEEIHSLSKGVWLLLVYSSELRDDVEKLVRDILLPHSEAGQGVPSGQGVPPCEAETENFGLLSKTPESLGNRYAAPANGHS